MDEYFDSNLRVEGFDFEETDNKFIIFSVPILAEMVQDYNDGMVLKDATEIKKVVVQNIPLTMVDESPSHPEFLTGAEPSYVADVQVGFMTEPTRLKSTADVAHKRYADFIIDNNDKTKVLIDDYKNGGFIDTSIGFKCKDDKTPGTFKGKKYDYIQRDIVLDHNAILIDAQGRKATGRMPSPIGGIGADSNNKKIPGDNMSEDIKELQKDNAALKKQIDDSNKKLEKIEADAKLAKEKADDEADAKKTQDAKTVEEQKTRMDELTIERDNFKKEIDSKDVELQKFKDAEKEVMDAKRDALKKADPDHAELYDTASEELITKFADKLNENKDSKSKNIGADMMPISRSANVAGDKRMKNWKANGNVEPSKKDKGDE